MNKDSTETYLELVENVEQAQADLDGESLVKPLFLAIVGLLTVWLVIGIFLILIALFLAALQICWGKPEKAKALADRKRELREFEVSCAVSE